MIRESERNLRNAAEFFNDINYTDPMNVRMYIRRGRGRERERYRECVKKRT
jgi:hypothetical protein